MKVSYVEKWKTLRGAAGITEDWHAEVIRNQFIIGEEENLRQDFIAKHVYDKIPQYSVEEREAVAEMACKALKATGYKIGKINPFWMPNLYAKYGELLLCEPL